MASPASSERPAVLLMSLAYIEAFDYAYRPLIEELHESADIDRVKNRAEAVDYLDQKTPKAIIIADGGLHDSENRDVLERVLSYVQSGGIVVVGFYFVMLTLPDEFQAFFRAFGLPWAMGENRRTTYQLSPSCDVPTYVPQDSLPPTLSIRAPLVDRARPEQKIYIPVDGAPGQSNGYPALCIRNTVQAAVAGAQVGNGYLAYVGDTQLANETVEIVLKLCGF